jgi:hypothetical protein
MMPVQVAWCVSVTTFTTATDVRGWSDTNEGIVGDMALLFREEEGKHGEYNDTNPA